MVLQVLGQFWYWVLADVIGCLVASIGFLAMAHIPLRRSEEQGDVGNLDYHNILVAAGRTSPFRPDHFPVHLRGQMASQPGLVFEAS